MTVLYALGAFTIFVICFIIFDERDRRKNHPYLYAHAGLTTEDESFPDGTFFNSFPKCIRPYVTFVLENGSKIDLDNNVFCLIVCGRGLRFTGVFPNDMILMKKIINMKYDVGDVIAFSLPKSIKYSSGTAGIGIIEDAVGYDYIVKLYSNDFETPPTTQKFKGSDIKGKMIVSFPPNVYCKIL